MEIGMGIHGEPGMKRETLQTADEITERMMTAILDDLQPAAGDQLAVMVNGLGATPPEELYIIYRKVHRDPGGAASACIGPTSANTPPAWRWPAPR